MTMQWIQRAVVIAACALVGCGGGTGGDRGTDAVQIRISLASDVCGVVRADATVTAEDITRIGPVALEVLASSIEGRLTGVPAGYARMVTVKAYNASGFPVYEGSTSVDVVEGQNVPANIVLKRNTTNCPSTGGIDVVGTICNSAKITVTWNDFVGGDAVARGCAVAGIDSVDIYMNGAFVSTWTCTDGGATITGVQPGSYTVDVEGVEPGGRIAYRDSIPVTTNSCGDALVTAQPAEGYVDLQYAFASMNECAPGSFIWFGVFDQIANTETVRVDAQTEPRFYRCGDPAGIVFPLPIGPHRLEWTEERVEPTPGNFQVSAAYCSPIDFTVQGGRSNGLPVTLADTSNACAK